MLICQIILWTFILYNVVCNFLIGTNISDLDLSNYYVTSSKIGNVTEFENIKQRLENGYLQVKIQLSEETNYLMILKQKDLKITSLETNYYVYSKNSTEPIPMTFNKEEHLLVEGFIDSYYESSSVKGYIENIDFYGSIEINQTIYLVEYLNINPKVYSTYKNSTKNAVVFKIAVNNSHYNFNFDNSSNSFQRRSTKMLENYKSYVNTGKTCSLFVLVDSSFLKMNHANDMNSAITYVISIVDVANSIFRSTDFDDDGEPDNIGFFIKYFIIIDSEHSPLNLIPKYYNKPVNGKDYLSNFSKYSILREVCLGVAFTAQAFHYGIIGISYTSKLFTDNEFVLPMGGICDRPLRLQPSKHLNCLAISSRLGSGDNIPKRILELSLSHELGHSFGSVHDQTQECQNYLMADRAPKVFHRQHYHFSPCSKKMIVENVVNKGYCLEDEVRSYCGNGKVEPGETCDCGTVRDCEALDACCFPYVHRNGCQVKDQYQCHPSEGLCCTRKCLYKNLTAYGIDCRNFQKSCPCQNNEKTCLCGINGSCTKNICSHQECTRLNLLECECPYKSQQHNCEICCEYMNKCWPASTITTKIIQTNVSAFTILKHFQVSDKSRKLYHKEVFCQDAECITVYFRKFSINEYCLLHGQVGKCVPPNVCIIPKRKRCYPNIPLDIINMNRAKSPQIIHYLSLNIILLKLLLIKYI